MGEIVVGSVGEVRPLVELASGVDAFYFSGKVRDRPAELFDRLDRLRESASIDRGRARLMFGGVEFELAAGRRRQYDWVLRHEYGDISVTANDRFPELFVQPRAVALHGLGARETVGWFEQVIFAEVGDTSFNVHRIDLFADVQGLVVTPTIDEEFVTRCTSVEVHKKHGRVTGIDYGRKKTGSTMLRVYDKTEQIAMNGGDYWFPIWGDARDTERPVWRVEFQFGPTAVKEYRCSDIDVAFGRIGGLWAAATTIEFRHCTPTGDSNRSRWPISPHWTQLQQASLSHDAVPLERLTAAEVNGSLRTLMGPLVGTLTSFGALLDCTSLTEVIEKLPTHVARYEERTGRRFSDRLELKTRQ